MQNKHPSISPGHQGRWFWSMLALSVVGHAAVLALPMVPDSPQKKTEMFYKIGFRKLINQPAVIEQQAVENSVSSAPPLPKLTPQVLKNAVQPNRTERKHRTAHPQPTEKVIQKAARDDQPSLPVETSVPPPVEPAPAAAIVQPSIPPVAVNIPLTVPTPAEVSPHYGPMSTTKPQTIEQPTHKAGQSSQSIPQAAVVAPTYMENPRPTYPPLARQRGWQGDVLLRVFVNTTGDVTAVRLEQSSGHRVLDKSAMKQIRSWHFRPASRGTAKIDGEVTVPIHFRLKRS